MDAEFPRFVTGGGDYSTPVRRTADYQRFAAVLRMFALLHRSEERVHIDVDDFSFNSHTGIFFFGQRPNGHRQYTAHPITTGLKTYFLL